MATEHEKQELVDALTFTPRDVRIQIWGYGGEIVMGRVSREAYRWWTREAEAAGVELHDFVFDWSWEEENGDKAVPAEARFITPGEWHECDNISHESGAEVSDLSGITITDEETQEQLFEFRLGINELEDKGVTVTCGFSEDTEDAGTGNACFIGQSVEKGVFFNGTVRITQPFDPRLLEISYNSIADWDLVSGVEYDGEDIEGTDGYDTRGKSMDCSLTYIGRDLDTDPYDEHTVWPEGWLSEWHSWPSEGIAPERDGVYQVEIGEYEYRKIWWINEAWRDDHGVPVEGVSRWRGLNREIT
jgi:hypothetical protein